MLDCMALIAGRENMSDRLCSEKAPEQSKTAVIPLNTGLQRLNCIWSMKDEIRISLKVVAFLLPVTGLGSYMEYAQQHYKKQRRYRPDRPGGAPAVV